VFAAHLTVGAMSLPSRRHDKMRTRQYIDAATALYSDNYFSRPATIRNPGFGVWWGDFERQLEFPGFG
jgi:hypothetical protein